MGNSASTDTIEVNGKTYNSDVIVVNDKVIEDKFMNKSNQNICTEFTHLCLISENLEKIELLLNQGIDVDQSSCPYGYTPLIMASCLTSIHSNNNIIKLLIKYGANVNLQTKKEGYTALHTACVRSKYNSSIETVKILINSKCDVNIQNSNGQTALMQSVLNYSYCHPDIIKLLIDAGTDLNLIDNRKRNALIYACYEKYANANIVELLLKNWINVNHKNDNGYTALMCVVNYPETVTSIKIVNLLLEYFADTNLVNSDGETAFDIAKKLGNEVIIKILSDHQKK
ncbi:repeat protein [Cotonvirus japonicus]|uniref:Repeat protein n=1 Tax=Cotonvirus japonicus TaxID=2811091 RepID=A0ABM7NT53_9VIRU|nr:repeat protein [Cotonvirus japonicus]BCS83281.1 repeat protein [Cotonvirus japonicus]